MAHEDQGNIALPKVKAGNPAKKIYMDSGSQKKFIGIYPEGRSVIINPDAVALREGGAKIQLSYRRIASEYSNMADLATDTVEVDSEVRIEVDPLKHTPFIPDTVFSSLPILLREGCQSFTNKRERDVFLTSALSILSGCFWSVSGDYRQAKVYPNLFTFIVAPAASGKGAMVFAKQLGLKIHRGLVEESEKKLQKYNLDMKAYHAEKKDKTKNPTLTPPIAPDFKVLFIPGDVSASRVIEHLTFNGGTGVFCETEADTMGGSFKQEWGGYSHLLRKAFQHEPISYSRKGSSEYKEVECPRLSVALSGTPSQVQGIISSAEDGLFSRFIYYAYKEAPYWQDVSPQNKRNLTQYFGAASETVAAYAALMNKTEIRFDLTEGQWKLLNQIFEKWLTEISALLSEEADSSIKRLGLILFRIAMVLSVLKKAEKDECSAEIICEDAEFNVALELAQVYKAHAIVMFTKLPKSGAQAPKGKLRFFEALPDSIWFRRKEAGEIGKALGISERSVTDYLKLFVNTGLLEKGHKDGQYKKAASPSLPKLLTSGTMVRSKDTA